VKNKLNLMPKMNTSRAKPAMADFIAGLLKDAEVFA